MRNQYKILAEKYQVIQENIEKPTLKVGSDGVKMWFQNGKLHRLDGPAVERLDGSKAWYQNGKLHRLDGPAVEYPDGTKMWYINGKQYSEKKFKTQVNIFKGLEVLSRIRSKQ